MADEADIQAERKWLSSIAQEWRRYVRMSPEAKLEDLLRNFTDSELRAAAVQFPELYQRAGFDQMRWWMVETIQGTYTHHTTEIEAAAAQIGIVRPDANKPTAAAQSQLPQDIRASPIASGQPGPPFEVGATLSRTMELLTGGFVRFSVLALIPLLPLLFVEIATANGSLSARQGSSWSALLPMLLNPLASATILYGAIKEMRGEIFTVGQSLGVVLSRVLAIFGISFCVGVATLIAAIALLFPALMVMCMLYVAIPACIIERLGVFASMGRSSDLTRGYRWPIFGLILIVWIISVVLSGLVAFLLARVGAGLISGLINFGWQVVIEAFTGVLVAVIYHNLRVAKEGVDVSKIANVFD